MKCYKLTDENGQTRNNTQWGENITHTANNNTNNELCNDSWIHCYDDPILAVMMNPAHATFKNPILWEAEGSGITLSDGVKRGFKTLTTIKQIPFPTVTTTQKVAFGILCAQQVYFHASWNSWAEKWLSGEDRSASSASYASYAAFAYASVYASAAAAASSASYASAYASVYASSSSAFAASYASASGSAAAISIPFIKLAHKAMEY